VQIRPKYSATVAFLWQEDKGGINNQTFYLNAGNTWILTYNAFVYLFVFQGAENIASLRKLATKPPTSVPTTQDEKKGAGDDINDDDDDDVPGKSFVRLVFNVYLRRIGNKLLFDHILFLLGKVTVILFIFSIKACSEKNGQMTFSKV